MGIARTQVPNHQFYRNLHSQYTQVFIFKIKIFY